MQQLNWNSVESSNIDALAYEDSHMYVRFKGGRIYQYENVPQMVFDTIREAESVGGTFHKLIKLNAEAYPYKMLSHNP